MKKKLFWLVLILSICFNFFYLVGHHRARKTLKMLKSPEGRAILMAREINLTDSQTEACSKFLVRQQVELDALKKQGVEEIEEFMRLALGPDRNMKRMNPVLDKLCKMWKKGALIRADCLRDMFAVMTREQRQDLTRWVKEKRAAWK